MRKKHQEEITFNGCEYRFPLLIKGTDSMIYSANKYRQSYVSANEERFKYLCGNVKREDRFNWKLLHDLKVTPQEYVILFSPDAGDIFARSINSCFDDEYEFIDGSQDKYEY